MCLQYRVEPSHDGAMTTVAGGWQAPVGCAQAVRHRGDQRLLQATGCFRAGNHVGRMLASRPAAAWRLCSLSIAEEDGLKVRESRGGVKSLLPNVAPRASISASGSDMLPVCDEAVERRKKRSPTLCRVISVGVSQQSPAGKSCHIGGKSDDGTVGISGEVTTLGRVSSYRCIQSRCRRF